MQKTMNMSILGMLFLSAALSCSKTPADSTAANNDEKVLDFSSECAKVKFSTSFADVVNATITTDQYEKVVRLSGAGTYCIGVKPGKVNSISIRLKNASGRTYPALVESSPQNLQTSSVYDFGAVEERLFCENSKKVTSLRLMTFNILRGDLNGPAHLWENRVEACLAMLEDIRPDILNLQECSSVQRNDILDRFPEYGAVGLSVSGKNDAEIDDNGEAALYANESSNPVIYNSKALILEAYGTYWLSDTPKKYSYTWYSQKPRTLTWTRFRTRDGGKRFICISIHLHNNGGIVVAPYKDDKAIYGNLNRKKSLTLLVDEVLPKINPEGLPVILSGDFNCKVGSDCLTVLEGHLNLAADMAPKADTGSTYNGFTYNESKWSRIDHIWSTGLQHSSFEVVWRPYSGVKWISDHYPVYTDFSLGATAEFTTSLGGWSKEQI